VRHIHCPQAGAEKAMFFFLSKHSFFYCPDSEKRVEETEMANAVMWGVMTAGLRESLSGEDTTELLQFVVG
jgi:hypothetical protein